MHQIAEGEGGRRRESEQLQLRQGLASAYVNWNQGNICILGKLAIHQNLICPSIIYRYILEVGTVAIEVFYDMELL